MLGNAASQGPIGIGADRKRKMQMQLMMQQHQQHQQQHHQYSNNGQHQFPAIGAPAVGSGPGNSSLSGAATGASCVLFVAEIPPNTCELELKRVFQEFGKLEQIFVMPGKQHALVEFLRLADAERLVAMHQSGFAVCANGGNLVLSFSNRPRIDACQESYQSTTPQTCLLLTFYNVRMDFNCESLRQICSPYGLLDRCLLVRQQQDGLLRAVMEFEKLEDAVLTKPNLNGANMYANCNAIRCEYVRHTAFEYFASREAVVEEYRYEATGPAAATAVKHQPVDAGMMQGGGSLMAPAGPSGMLGGVAAVAASLGGGGGPAKRPRMPGMMMQQHQQLPPMPPKPLGATGLLMQQQLQQQQQPQPLHQQLMQPAAAGMPPGLSRQRGMGGAQQQQPQHHPVLVVRGTSPQMNCDRLFNVLVLYGNVGRIKFLTTKEGFALVEMLDATSAQQAVDFLHGQTVLGSTLKVTHSDQGAIKRGGKDFTLADGSAAEKAYDSAKLNRFMSQEAVAKNQASLGRSGRSLYFWGCPDGTTEATIREILKLAGASEPTEVTMQNEKGATGWLTFANVADATDAICLANHSIVGESGNTRMKLSYAVKK